jgi:hypothetical protein
MVQDKHVTLHLELPWPSCGAVQGLAAAAAAGSITISQLLQYSAVCGCGLDTVPVPGPSGDAAADADTTASIAALLCDVNALAYRCADDMFCGSGVSGRNV